MTRAEFEKDRGWRPMGVDGLPYCANAQPDCKTCKGFGLVDVGHSACILILCPNCWVVIY